MWVGVVAAVQKKVGVFITNISTVACNYHTLLYCNVHLGMYVNAMYDSSVPQRT